MSDTWDGIASLLSPASQSASGVLTLADLEAAFQSMRDQATDPEPLMIIVSPKDARRIWRYQQLAFLYLRYPLPKRKLRKTVLRKRQALINRGQRRIARDEREIYDRVILPPYEG